MKNELAFKEDATVPEYDGIVTRYQTALQAVDDVIFKNYITDLTNLEIVPLDREILENNIDENVSLFKVTEMVYEKEEFSTHKFASIFNTLSSIDATIFIIINSDGEKTDFYMGIRSNDSTRTTSSIYKMLKNSTLGQFPGIKIEEYKYVDDIKEVMSQIKGNSISAVSCVANNRNKNINNDEEFVQGLEKLALSMRGQKYTGIILANTTKQEQLRELRKGYEDIYTNLSAFATMQVNYGKSSSVGRNESTSDSTTRTDTNTNSTSHSTTRSTTKTTTKTETISNSITTEKSKSVNYSAANIVKEVAKVLPIAKPITVLATATSSTRSKSESRTESTSKSESIAKGTAKTYGYGESFSKSEGTTKSYTSGKSSTEGQSNAITLTAHNKSVENILTRIDQQLERLNEFESLGMYECAAYFMSEDQTTAEIAASTYEGIMKGENSGVEGSAINSWGIFEKNTTKYIEDYVKNFIHPVFKYSGLLGDIEVTPSAMVSGNELAIHMGLPRKSVRGLPVIEHASFGEEVVKYGNKAYETGINLGKVFNMGSSYPNNVKISKDSLSMHTFVTGSTGSGKSNTIYEIIRQTKNLGAKFMVIEPAKGEYKHIFGNQSDVRVYGTNPQYSDLLRINPFKFPAEVHVLEHVDRLVEIFNVCWPMYAAMPAVLKDALLRAYENCGWDLFTSKNLYDSDVYPTFIDLNESLKEVISNSAYSEEVKNNYMGSLVTRISSLTNGLNGQIFTSNEISSKILFDENVIVDLSRIGSAETKSLIMGIIIMRLNEYRMATAKSMNTPFKHMTILEEAHNILRRTSTEQSLEGSNVAGKSVEMISNAIAEMRTYGEGFVIVDQSPSAVDISAIRNTNTKIVMRLPDEEDRRLVGKAAGLKDDQLDEITKLPKGVAVVYQNDWVEPVLCKIQKYKGEESEYKYEATVHTDESTARLKKSFLLFLLRNKVNNPIEVDINALKEDLVTANISTKNKLAIKKLIDEYELKNDLLIWKEKEFGNLSKIVSDLLDGSTWVKSAMDTFSEMGLTNKICQEVKKQVDGIPKEYAAILTLCLMKAEAEESEKYNRIYKKWKGGY
ncbi:ATP-binding protein [Ligilactobacillus salivarius]|uniref:ATP-binding protein n=1 Tax=Ligilactobacillus salivarius TaxID=1624 RepID=UPI003977E19D